MHQFNCPSCAGPVEVKSPSSVWIVCGYCDSILVDHSETARKIGEMAALPSDPSPLQIGTNGRYLSDSFTLIGRLRVSWERGAWNEWHAWFDDGRTGWLAEWAGQYAMSFAVHVDNLPTADWFNIARPSKTVRLGERSYHIHDIKNATCTASEGELPFAAPVGRKTRTIDVSGRRGLFGTLERSDEGVAFYEGRYQSFDELALRDLREIDGWRP